MPKSHSLDIRAGRNSGSIPNEIEREDIADSRRLGTLRRLLLPGCSCTRVLARSRPGRQVEGLLGRSIPQAEHGIRAPDGQKKQPAENAATHELSEIHISVIH